MNRRPLALLLLATVPFACSRVEPASVLRLVDLLADAEVRSAVDLADGDEAFALLARRIAETTAARGDQAGFTRLGGGAARTVLGPDAAAGDLALSVLPIPPLTPLSIEIAGRALDGAGVLLRAVEISRPPAADELRDASALSALLAQRDAHVHELAPSSPERARLRFRSGLHSRALVVLVGTGGADPEIERVAIDAVPDALSRLLRLRTEFDHPHVRRVDLNGVFREAIVLAAPGEVRFEVTLPRGAPELTLFGAVTCGAPDLLARLEVRVRCGAEVRTVEHAPPAGVRPAWTPLRLDLSAFAGRDVEVRLLAAAADDAPGARFLLFGAPTIERTEPVDEDLPPDVVIVSLDTVRADRTALLGARRPTTPHLAALAPTSMVFEQAIAPAPWTLPSHATLLTGQEPERHGVQLPGKRLDPRRVPLLAREFRARGFRTAAFTAGGFVHPSFGFATGFERYGVDDPVLELESSDATALAAYLEAPSAAPRFVFVHTYAAHGFEPGAGNLEAIGFDPRVVAEVIGEVPAGVNGLMELVDRLRDDPRGAETLYALYDASLRRVDALVGAIVESLRASNRFERTLLIVTSDHGQEILERGAVGHGRTLHDEVIHVPLLVRGPGVAPGRYAAVVGLSDVAPTLRQLFGIEATAPTDGRSLVPVLRGGAIAREPAVSTHADAADDWVQSLRGERFKLILDRRPGHDVEAHLYSFPGELDVTAERADLAGELRLRLEQRIERLRAGGTGASDVTLPGALVDELKELGYLGGG